MRKSAENVAARRASGYVRIPTLDPETRRRLFLLIFGMTVIDGSTWILWGNGGSDLRYGLAQALLGIAGLIVWAASAIIARIEQIPSIAVIPDYYDTGE